MSSPRNSKVGELLMGIFAGMVMINWYIREGFIKKKIKLGILALFP